VESAFLQRENSLFHPPEQMESTRAAAAQFLHDAPLAQNDKIYAMHQNAAPAQQNEEQFRYLRPGDSASI
jgi:hypothetical protein